MPDCRIETHAHTDLVSPCGCLSPRELVEGCLRAGYHALVVTDHLTATLPLFQGVGPWPERVHRFFSGYRAAALEGRRLGLTVLPAFELTFRDLPGRDFLVYGIDEPALCRMGDVCSLDPARFGNLARAAGALVFQAHPFRSESGPVDAQWIDGVEVCNGNPRHDSGNDRAAAFASRHRLLTISGSDVHRPEDIGRGGITLPEPPASGRDIVRWYRQAPEAVGLFCPEPSPFAGVPAG